MGEGTDDEKPTGLREILASEGKKAVSGLLGKPETRRACLEALSEVGCGGVRGYVILFLIEKAMLGASAFLSAAAASRLEELCMGVPALRDAILKIAQLDKAEQEKIIAHRQMLDEMEADTKAEALKLDETSQFQVVSAIYHGAKLENLGSDIERALTSLRADVSKYVAELKKEQNYPVLGWNLQTGPTSERSIIETLKFNSGQYEFLGREEEFDFLQSFCGDPSAQGPRAKFTWLLITAAGGEGKSRLALEFTRQLESEQRWYAGRLLLGQLHTLDTTRWRPDRPTFIVIDYPAQDPAGVRKMLTAIQQNHDDYDWPVRVLLLERESGSEWFGQILHQDSASDALRQHLFRHDGQRFDNGWRLPQLRTEALVQAMRSRFESAGFEPPSDDLLAEVALQIDPRDAALLGEHAILKPRPLFAMAGVEALILKRNTTGKPYREIAHTLDREGVLQSIIDRDRSTRWRPAVPGPTDQVLWLHENLVATVNAGLGFDRSVLRGLSAEAGELLPDPDRKSQWALNENLVRVMSGMSGSHFEPLEPDILGEYFALERFKTLRETGYDHKALASIAFRAGSRNAIVFIQRCLVDFPERILDLELLWPDNHVSQDNAEALGELCSSVYNYVTADFGREELGAAIRNWGPLDRLSGLRQKFPDMASLARWQATQAATGLFIHHQEDDILRWQRMDRIFRSIAQNFPADAEVAPALAMCFYARGYAEISKSQVPDGRGPANWKILTEALAELRRLIEFQPTVEMVAFQYINLLWQMLGQASLAEKQSIIIEDAVPSTMSKDWDDGILDEILRIARQFRENIYFPALYQQGCAACADTALNEGDYRRAKNLLARTFDNAEAHRLGRQSIAKWDGQNYHMSVIAAALEGDLPAVDDAMNAVRAALQRHPESLALSYCLDLSYTSAYFVLRCLHGVDLNIDFTRTVHHIACEWAKWAVVHGPESQDFMLNTIKDCYQRGYLDADLCAENRAFRDLYDVKWYLCDEYKIRENNNWTRGSMLRELRHIYDMVCLQIIKSN